MNAGAWVSLLVGLGLAAWVALPLLRPVPARRADDDALSEARDLQSRKDMLLTSLKDLEDDRQTDKIGEDDYAELHARLSSEAVDVLRRLDAESERRAAEKAAGAVRHPRSRRSGRSG